MQGLVRGHSAAPVIETARLRLRAHRPDDLAPCWAMWADPAVTRHIGGKPASRHETWSKLLRYAGLWSLLGYGYWALEDRATAGFVGELGFADFKRDVQPSPGERPEIGWALAPHAHGKGYATEAVQAALAWADAHFGATKTVCLISAGNLASIRVAEKCGYREYARTEYHGETTMLFER